MFCLRYHPHTLTKLLENQSFGTLTLTLADSEEQHQTLTLHMYVCPECIATPHHHVHRCSHKMGSNVLSSKASLGSRRDPKRAQIMCPTNFIKWVQTYLDEFDSEQKRVQIKWIQRSPNKMGSNVNPDFGFHKMGQTSGGSPRGYILPYFPT